MRIDRTHRKWAGWAAGLLGIALLGYLPYALLSPRGPTGGSAVGLIYGTAGYGTMIFAALLGLRKKFPIWRIGRAQTWMRGHLWLGLLSYPLILFHAGFHFGSGLTQAMMWIFTLVVVSGIVGAALQHYLPHIITERVPMETIYDQIDRVQSRLLREADELMGSISEAGAHYGLLVPKGALRGTATTLLTVEFRAAVQVRGLYEKSIRSYLTERGAHGHSLTDRRSSKATFAQLRTVAAQSIHSIIDDLENICEEKRDLDRQSRFHRLLHGWLLVHVPLSLALVVMGAIHAFMALRY